MDNRYGFRLLCKGWCSVVCSHYDDIDLVLIYAKTIVLC